MEYSWNPKVDIQYKNQKVLYINPDQGTWLKSTTKIKDLLDDVVYGDNQFNFSEVQKKIVVQQFCEAGMLVRDNKILQSSQPKYINSLYLVVTKRCNLTCNFCAMGSNSSIPFEQLKMDEVKSVIDKLKGYKIGNIIITGGEPFFRKDIFKIIDYIHEHIKTKIIVCTNGLLLNQERIEQIKGKVRRIDISVENLLIASDKRDMEKMFKRLDTLKQNKINISLSYVITKENQKRVFSFLDLANKYDALYSLKTVKLMGSAKGNDDLVMSANAVTALYYEIFNYIYSMEYQSEPFQRFLAQPLIPAYSCSAKEKILSVYTDGNVYSCHSLSYPEFSPGNVLNDEMSALVENNLTKANSQLYEKSFNIDEREVCKSCEIRYFCQGYCFAELYDNQSNILSLPSECEIKKAIIHFNLWDYDAKRSFMENLEVFLKINGILPDKKRITASN